MITGGIGEEAFGRFLAACREDPRVVAAFLGGSHAARTADEYSDLDLYLIVNDQDYDTFFAERRAFLGRLGEAVFFETSRNSASTWSSSFSRAVWKGN